MVDKETSAHRKREDALASGRAGKSKRQQAIRHSVTEEAKDLLLRSVESMAADKRGRGMVSLGPGGGGRV